MATITIPVSMADLTARQLLRHIAAQNTIIFNRLDHLERAMSELSQSVDDLKAAVDGVASRLLPQITALETALAAAQANDASDAAAIAAGLADASAATATIRAEVEQLNTLAQPAPVTPTPDPVPAPDPTV